MTENKLWKIIEEQFISYYGGCGYKISNGECGFWLWHSKEESQKVCDKLNSILDEKEQLKIDLGIAEDNHKLDKEIIDDLQKYIKKLEKENKKLKELVIEVDNELEIRDIVCGAGKFRLEEWGKHRYNQFYKGDEELEDETVVIMLMELEKENNELKEEKELLKNKLDRIEYILPHYLSCAEISEFRGETVKEDIALMEYWNKRY